MNPRSFSLSTWKAAAILAALVLFVPVTALGQLTIPSDGSDGAFNPTANITVDLSQAVTGSWDQPGTGAGVYDPAKWAVVFKYSEVNIPSGVTVSFANHPSGAPVVWLVQNNVTISGAVNLNGENASPHQGIPSRAGPGGFRGGSGPISQTAASGGYGPGGGAYYEGAGSYGTGSSAPTYGNVQIVPLIGGSGGSGGDYFGNTRDSGAGGGAILIAASGTVTANGSVNANGGATNDTGGPSGGAVRIIASTFAGNNNGVLSAVGSSNGGAGRIRIEANAVTFTGASQPVASIAVPASPPLIWPPDTAPTIRITKVGEVDAPADPSASFDFPNQDVTLSTITPVSVRIEAQNMPTDWTVVLRVVPRVGQDFRTNAALVSGDASSSVWEAQINAPVGFAALQVRASKPQP